MPGILATSAQQPILAQESPVQQWLSGWLAYLSENLPVLFVVLTILVGTILLVRGGGFKEAISFVLEFLTKSYDVAVGDDAGGEVEEGFVNVVAAFPPDA